MTDFFKTMTSFFQQSKQTVEKYIWPNFTPEALPKVIKGKVEKLPILAQTEFYYEYSKTSNGLKTQRTIAAILFAIFTFNFLIPGSLATIWWLYHIKETKVPLSANEALKRVLIKHKLSSSGRKSSALENIMNSMQQRPPIQTFEKKTKQPKPRVVKQTKQHEAYQYTIENLKEGFMLDYNLKTWQVTNINQYDWKIGITEKEFNLVSNIESFSLYLKNENGFISTVLCKQVNIYVIDENLEAEILHKNKPYNILTYEEIPYYRENTNTGLLYNLTNKSGGQKIIAWEYYDGQRQNIIRIEQHGRTDFKTWVGKTVSSYDFTDILPNA